MSADRDVNAQEIEALAGRMARNERKLHDVVRVVGEYDIKLAGVDTKLDEVGRQLGRMTDKDSQPTPWGAIIAAGMLLITLATLALNPLYSERSENFEEHKKLDMRLYEQAHENGRQEAQLEILMALETARLATSANRHADSHVNED